MGVGSEAKVAKAERAYDQADKAARAAYYKATANLSEQESPKTQNHEAAGLAYLQAIDLAEVAYRKAVETANRLPPEDYDQFLDVADEAYTRSVKAAGLAHRKAVKAAGRGDIAPVANVPARIEHGSGDYHPQDIVSITEAAQQLRVSRNDIHLLLKPNKAWGLQYYKRRDVDLLRRLAADKTQPECFMILLLQDRKQRSEERGDKRANPKTKTGKIKASHRDRLPRNRPKQQHQDEHTEEDWQDDDEGLAWSQLDSKRNRTTPLVPLHDEETSDYTPNEAPYDKGPMAPIGHGADE